MKKDLLSLTEEEMKAFAAEVGEKPYRGKQLFQWIQRGASSFDEMTSLPESFRRRLEEAASIRPLKVLEVQEDPEDGTRKFLFALTRGNESAEESAIEESTSHRLSAVEGVFMKYRYGNTMCVSSQVGCRMGCTFCASALGGFERNLSPGEMLAQIMEAERYTEEKVDHLVLMGMGEPFDNYENVSRFLRILHEPGGRNMSWRNMTVSTSGIIPGLIAFGEDFPQVNLAVSLHRTEDRERSRLMPVNRKYPVGDLLQASRDYTEKTRRRITFEYALIAGENDGEEDIRKLTSALKGMLCHVNLIPLNEVGETGLKASSRQRAMRIAEELTAAGIPATVRRRLGASIQGACGQLRLHRREEESAGNGKEKDHNI